MMIEKVNPSHPDKVADRIAGALVDLAYKKIDNPRCAFEVLLGHGAGLIIAETSIHIDESEVQKIVARIAEDQVDPQKLVYRMVPQDPRLADNQNRGSVRCGDNGIFKGEPVKPEEEMLSWFAKATYEKFPTDGKFILDDGNLTICQSRATEHAIDAWCRKKTGDMDLRTIKINPLGYWSGGLDVDSGATNRKLGSDMGRGVTGGGLHGKDLSKADVSINIWCHLEAQRTGRPVELSCSIGDEKVNGIYYSAIVEQARQYIHELGGFEKFAEWGLI